MRLSKRPPVYSLPSYSLTGDLLGFLRCGLQYRYTKIGKLPATRPLQAWFGSFIHGVLEEAYRRYLGIPGIQPPQAPPYADDLMDEMCKLVDKRIAAQGLFPWSQDLEELGYRRAKAAVNELGALLFPMISKAEVRLTGARPLPKDLILPQYQTREADRYEVSGVVDVITHVELHDPELQNNQLLRLILQGIQRDVPDSFEVIIDYKGMRRPPKMVAENDLSFWDIYAWQTQTYAYLRGKQQESLPVVAGVLIYLNELLPTRRDMLRLKKEIAEGTTDVLPEKWSWEDRVLNSWRSGQPVPDLPLEYRLKRAIRVVTVDPGSVQEALTKFDETVARIEICRGKELEQGRLVDPWEKNASDEETCSACDARTFCPSYGKEKSPSLPVGRG
ncbi:PD-(D/E)XK nuclease family protein [Picosynechococcus sp. PCC 73109]|uniref:PD-(D/E)XK nuclease family protein n=1 Tax=Picosynechococcus sp. PCC 73109 TaxID=374982 RepID=UPI00074592CE|nr:PD-(D/E)XK nuclease family protein [Picosynechococcus sp. PCC 73109]AMA10661.1 hypothetical protein AWQ23_14530 [Picosynechococcus sp. PCC 73109]